MKVYYAVEQGYFADIVYGIFSTKEKAKETILKNLEKETKENMVEGTSVLEYINECITNCNSVDEYINTLIYEFELDKPTNEKEED